MMRFKGVTLLIITMAALIEAQDVAMCPCDNSTSGDSMAQKAANMTESLKDKTTWMQRAQHR